MASVTRSIEDLALAWAGERRAMESAKKERNATRCAHERDVSTDEDFPHFEGACWRDGSKYVEDERGYPQPLGWCAGCLERRRLDDIARAHRRKAGTLHGTLYRACKHALAQVEALRSAPSKTPKKAKPSP